MQQLILGTGAIWWLTEPHCTKVLSLVFNGREPKTGLGLVFNFKLGCFDDVHVLIYADA